MLLLRRPGNSPAREQMADYTVIRDISSYTSADCKWFSEVPHGLNFCLSLLSQEDDSATLIVHDAGLLASLSVIFSIYCFISLSPFALMLCSCDVDWRTVLLLSLKSKVECPVTCLCLCLELWINSLDDSGKFLFWLVAEESLNNILCGEVPPRGPTSYSFIHVYDFWETRCHFRIPFSLG